ncbi:hypothetical protein [Streptomyces sp. NPDC058371]|uniref:hypothetical protein n=1 Tax=Streptomyces sp. NPDC058371 TaxID=3346463 RepID=UPI003665E72F
MGWADKVRRRRREGLNRADSDVNGAAAVWAAQLPVFLAIYVVSTFDDNPYGSGYGGAFGLMCVLVFAPPVLAVGGVLHAVTHAMPAAVLARLVVRRAGGPEWAWHLVFVLVLGAGWAAAGVVLVHWSFTGAATLIVGAGVLPALGIAHVRRRARLTGTAMRGRSIWLRSALGAVCLGVLVLVTGSVAVATGLIDAYEPPRLSADRLAGVWNGDDGAELRLRPGGRAELTAVPAQPESEYDGTRDFLLCDGTGSWLLDRDGDREDAGDGDREGDAEVPDGVAVRLGGCGDETFWTIGGTADRPELYVRFGDPDDGDLRVLTQRPR